MKWESESYPQWGIGVDVNWRFGLGFQISPYKADRGFAIILGFLYLWVWTGAHTERLWAEFGE